MAPLSCTEEIESLAIKSGAFFMPMTELKVVYRKVEDLIPYARNARVHSDAQVAENVREKLIRASEKNFLKRQHAELNRKDNGQKGDPD